MSFHPSSSLLLLGIDVFAQTGFTEAFYDSLSGDTSNSEWSQAIYAMLTLTFATQAVDEALEKTLDMIHECVVQVTKLTDGVKSTLTKAVAENSTKAVLEKLNHGTENTPEKIAGDIRQTLKDLQDLATRARA